MDKEMCGCIQRTSYVLPCACFIATKICEDKPILLDKIHHHWHRLCMSQESNEDGFSVKDEWNGLQERLKKVPYQMKLEMKEVLQKLAFPDTTMLSSPPRKVPTKGAKEKVDIARSRAKVALTSRIPSSWERVDSKIRIVNRHQQRHHFLKGKVSVLVKHHVPHFHHILSCQSLFWFQSLFRFKSLFQFQCLFRF